MKDYICLRCSHKFTSSDCASKLKCPSCKKNDKLQSADIDIDIHSLKVVSESEADAICNACPNVRVKTIVGIRTFNVVECTYYNEPIVKIKACKLRAWIKD